MLLFDIEPKLQRNILDDEWQQIFTVLIKVQLLRLLALPKGQEKNG
jgi:hypothetical protein